MGRAALDDVLEKIKTQIEPIHKRMALTAAQVIADHCPLASLEMAVNGNDGSCPRRYSEVKIFAWSAVASARATVDSLDQHRMTFTFTVTDADDAKVCNALEFFKEVRHAFVAMFADYAGRKVE